MSLRSVMMALLLCVLATVSRPALAEFTQEQTINQALATVERMKNDHNFQKNFQQEQAGAKAVLIVPSLYKGGFFLGAQYGNGVLLVRGRDSWSYPAFYTMSGASFGLQLGLVDSAIIFMIRTDKGLEAVLNNQFKFGADANVTFLVIGGGLGASTTSNLGADIVAYSLGGVGLYGGVSLEGTSLAPRESWNNSYYGQSVGARGIVIDRTVSNPQADRLRDFLAR